MYVVNDKLLNNIRSLNNTIIDDSQIAVSAADNWYEYSTDQDLFNIFIQSKNIPQCHSDSINKNAKFIYQSKFKNFVSNDAKLQPSIKTTPIKTFE